MRTQRTRREELLAEYDHSGLSQAAFARRAAVRYPTFAHWVQERRRAGVRAEFPVAATPRFVELGLPPASTAPATAPAVPELSATLPEGVVVRGAEPATLAALVRALREA